jgi:predicted nuclease of restriction endonuclease-like (RecB) superfamily
MTADISKTEKKPCKINLSAEFVELIEYKSKLEDKFIEQVFEDAIIQLLIPRVGEIGLGHPDFRFNIPLMKSPDIKETMFWIKIKLWKKLKEVKMLHRISIHAIVYTAISNHLEQYKNNGA